MLYYRYHGKILTILPIWVCLRDPCATPNQFAPQTLSQSLAIQGFGRAGSLFTFPRKGTETEGVVGDDSSFHRSLFTFPRKGTETKVYRGCPQRALFNHYLHFPVRGRKPLAALTAAFFLASLFTFPRKGTETTNKET